jgi:NAD(P)-dependent dehydrogenase (short-subunit alcohol dehydrogenase family)
MSTKKTALVTGANKGIGRAIAQQLASEGYTVWLGSRDAGRGQQAVDELRAAGHDVKLLVLDVTSDQSVAAAAQALARETDRLDVLVNNAGALTSMTTPPSQDGTDLVKSVYEVNVFGPIRVTQALLPLLKKAPAARVVMLSSSLGSMTVALDRASGFYEVNQLGYNSSKAALNSVTVAFAKELEPLGIKVNATCPGYVSTDMNGHTGTRTVEQGAATAVRLATLGADGPTAGFFNDDGAIPW